VLARSGVDYVDAHTTIPSDSFPGMAALVTGATPNTAGVYYDDSYDRTLSGQQLHRQSGDGSHVDETIEVDDSLIANGGTANAPT